MDTGFRQKAMLNQISSQAQPPRRRSPDMKDGRALGSEGGQEVCDPIDSVGLIAPLA